MQITISTSRTKTAEYLNATRLTRLNFSTLARRYDEGTDAGVFGSTPW